VISDLHWLIHQGHVIEFANGVLETAKKPLPKPPKPQAKAPAEAAASSVEAAATTEPAAAADTAAPVIFESAENANAEVAAAESGTVQSGSNLPTPPTPIGPCCRPKPEFRRSLLPRQPDQILAPRFNSRQFAN